LTARAHNRAVAELDALNAELVIVGVDAALAQRSGDIADGRALRGYDAVHLASALALGPGETILVTWDRDLSNAAEGAGLAVAPALFR
jgi:predicted nucleic acid-binding protein